MHSRLRSLFLLSLTLLVLLAASIPAYAESLYVIPLTGETYAEVNASEMPDFVDELEESSIGTRGNSAPSASKTTTLPYVARADISNSVYTNYCVQPASGSLRCSFEGYVNGDTGGKAAIILYLYNATTGKHVATRNIAQGTEFNMSTTFTGLRAGNSYYVRIQVTEKTSSTTRVTFALWLRNA